MRTSTRARCRRNVRKYKKYRNKRQQYGGFLNRYDFAYASQDTVNQVMKGLDALVPKLIGQNSKEINKIAEARIKHVMNQSRQQIQKIAPLIIGGAMEDVYKTTGKSDILQNLCKKKFLSSNENFRD